MLVNENGRSMIEMLGVLAIVGVLSVGGLAGYSKAMTKYKNNQLISQISELAMNIRNLFLQQGSYSNLSEQVIINSGITPNSIESDVSTSTLTHIFDGNIKVFTSVGYNGLPNAFELYVEGLPRTACVYLSTMDWGHDPSSGFQSMYIGTGEVTSAQMADVNAPTDSRPNEGIYTVGMHEDSLPLSVTAASTNCVCDDIGCVIGLKFL